MAKYDQPGFVSPIPGNDTFNARAGASGGSPGITASETAGAEVGRPVVSVVGVSSQVAAGMTQASVLAGDTCSLSSDAPVSSGGDPLTGLQLSDVASLGPHPAWHEPYGHPNAGSRPG
jgi:hypothetical protein